MFRACLTFLAIAGAVVCSQAGLAQLPEDTTEVIPWHAVNFEETPLRDITLVDLNFEGDLRLPITEQDRIATELKQITYSGDPDDVTEELEERVRHAWQNRGYFKVRVQGSSIVLSSNPSDAQIAAAFHIEEGQQYRLQQITFKGNKAISNTFALRALFAIEDGDVFDRSAISAGLENLGKAYTQYGYINFTSVPQTRFNEADLTISLMIDIDEGKQFFIGAIQVFGADPQILSDLDLAPGQVYNGRLVEAFIKRHLPATTMSEAGVLHQVLHEQAGTVDLVFDFRQCESSTEPSPSPSPSSAHTGWSRTDCR
jgi:outer membrane protein assembly factor BamA